MLHIENVVFICAGAYFQLHLSVGIGGIAYNGNFLSLYAYAKAKKYT
jgi:hypothetical protein